MPSCQSVIRTYYSMTLLTTFAASFIWGVNTLFLLDAGLSNSEAFAANAFYTLGMVLFEVPTGVVADTKGRRLSFLLGTITLLLGTVGYIWLWQAKLGFVYWAIMSLFLGLGFTFFSGAVEAWVVDALQATGYEGELDKVFARNQFINGFAMLIGTASGGYLAQYTNLGVPYVLRCVLLVLTFIFALVAMKDLGFSAKKGCGPIKEMKAILGASIEHGWKNPTVRMLMLAAPFNAGVMVYAFYAMQPFLLELYGDPTAYGIAGLAASIVAGAQMIGSMLVPKILSHFNRRTSILALNVVVSTSMVVLIGLVTNFYMVIGIFVVWALMVSTSMPVRQALLNKLIPSEQRATVLSFDSLFASGGGAISQPTLGKVADVWSYGMSYVVCGFVQILALPFLLRARSGCAEEDRIK